MPTAGAEDDGTRWLSVYGGSFATRTQPPRVPGRERLALLVADSAVDGGRRALELPRVGGGEEGGRSALELNGVEDGDRRVSWDSWTQQGLLRPGGVRGVRRQPSVVCSLLRCDAAHVFCRWSLCARGSQ